MSGIKNKESIRVWMRSDFR